MEKSRAIETLRANYPDACYEQLREAVDAAIEALRQSEPCGDKSYTLWKESYEELKRRMDELTSCSDTISRQAALDALDKRFDNIPMEQTAEILMLRKDLRELPTIQPEKAQLSQEGTTSDLISRRAVLDAVEKNACNTQRIMDAVNNLPPAQPEPHEGHWINGKCDRCGEHAPFWCMASTYHESNYCPNCGAKMTISK